MHSLHVGHMMLSATAMATLRANEPSTHGGLGPGAGAWKHEPAEAHGMSAEALERAAADLAELLPVRYCLLVAHDGAIVHESYEHNSSETLYSLDSAMKLGTAALVGIAHTDGLIDLDLPLAEHGLSPTADWGDFFDLVTPRHLLSMASGVGQKPPGTAFAYDSGSHLQELVWLLEHVTGENSISWATRRLALPLGLPSMFARQSSSTHIHAGGDNRLPCSALLRLGQLVSNAGWWPAADGKARRLIGAAYMREWLRPQFPQLNSAYGFLTWLNQPTHRPQDSFKRPGLGWCDARTNGAWVDAGGTPVGAPASLAMGAGWLAKYVWVLPETRTVLVSIGQSWTRSAACQPPRNIWNYDEAYAARVLWRAVGAAITPQPLLPSPPLLAALAGVYSLPPPRYGGEEAAAAAWEEVQRAREADPWVYARRAAWGIVPGGVSDFALLIGASAEVVAESAATLYDQHGKPALLPTVRGPIAALGERDPPPAPPSPAEEEEDQPGWLLLGGYTGGEDEPARAPGRGTGSCYCSCPIDLGFGQCFDGRSEGECRGLEALGREYCPAIGIVNQCAQTWSDCSFMPIILSWRLLQGNPLVCTTQRPCGRSPSLATLSQEPRFPPDEGAISPDATGTCECYAERFVRCEWDAEPRCGMRPGNGDARKGKATPEEEAHGAAEREKAVHSGDVYSDVHSETQHTGTALARVSTLGEGGAGADIAP